MPTSGADPDIIFKLGVSSYLVEVYGLHKRIVYSPIKQIREETDESYRLSRLRFTGCSSI